MCLAFCPPRPLRLWCFPSYRDTARLQLSSALPTDAFTWMPLGGGTAGAARTSTRALLLCLPWLAT